MTDPNAPAYPIVAAGDVEDVCLGLTKRERFAMAAMQGLLAHDTQGIATAPIVAEWAREHADAMLAELARRAVTR